MNRQNSLAAAIRSLKSRNIYINNTSVRSLLNNDEITETSIQYITLATSFFEQLPNYVTSLFKGAYIYGSTARGVAQEHFGLIEIQLVLNGNFIGSLFYHILRKADLDIEIITDFPDEAFNMTRNSLERYIQKSGENCYWSIRFSSLHNVIQGISDLSHPSLYRQVLNLTEIITIMGHKMIEDVKKNCRAYYSSIDNECYEEKKRLENMIISFLSDSSSVFLPSEIYCNLAPVFFEEWKPSGNKLQRDKIPKIRLPQRNHLDSVCLLDNRAELEKLLTNVKIISF